MKRFYYNDVEQDSERWRTLRFGRLTGSVSQSLLVNGKRTDGLGAGAVTLAYKKAAEIITGEDPYSFSNKFTDRGNELEPLAREAYQDTTFNTVVECGFITFGDYVGCSVDGLVGDDGIIEIKCSEQAEFMRILDETKDDVNQLKIDSDYLKQIQFNLWVSGRKWCDHICFHPKFDRSIVIIRIERDEETIAKFDVKSSVFIEEVKRIVKADK